MSKQFLAILAIIILGFIGVFTVTQKKSSNNGSSNGNSSQLSNHVIGENQKGVVLVEYGDYQCPACGQFYPLVKQVVEKYKTDIQFQFRNFPLQQIHPNARAGSRAAEAAAKQNKFWEMHDTLYEQQKSWVSLTDVTPAFEAYAQQLGLDVAKFKTDFASTEVNDIINADYAEGTRLGVEGTPTFFLQGKKIDPNPTDVAGFSKLIDEAIAAKKQ